MSPLAAKESDTLSVATADCTQVALKLLERFFLKRKLRRKLNTECREHKSVHREVRLLEGDSIGCGLKEHGKSSVCVSSQAVGVLCAMFSLEKKILVFFVFFTNRALGFGKYLQQERESPADELRLQQPDSSDSVDDTVAVFVVDDDDKASAPVYVRTEDLQIEVIAAVLIASLFALFIFIYVCFLQCWWRYADGLKKVPKVTDAEDERCACFAHAAWEEVDDIDKYFEGGAKIEKTIR